MEIKYCNKCSRDLPTTKFGLRTYGNGEKALQSKCKDCERVIRKQYYKPHEYARRKFKLSEEDYNTLINRSQGLCEVCNTPMTKRCIDHDHKTGKVRGVLCNNCNTSLGLLNDSVETLNKLIQYLEQS